MDFYAHDSLGKIIFTITKLKLEQNYEKKIYGDYSPPKIFFCTGPWTPNHVSKATDKLCIQKDAQNPSEVKQNSCACQNVAKT